MRLAKVIPNTFTIILWGDIWLQTRKAFIRSSMHWIRKSEHIVVLLWVQVITVYLLILYQACDTQYTERKHTEIQRLRRSFAL